MFLLLCLEFSIVRRGPDQYAGPVILVMEEEVEVILVDVVVDHGIVLIVTRIIDRCWDLHGSPTAHYTSC